MSVRPNIVLVHGAWADGSCWSAVIQRLQGAGYDVTAVQLPETSLADDVARVRHVLSRQDGPTGAMVPASWYLQAQRFRRWYHDRVMELFTSVDIILAPATP